MAVVTISRLYGSGGDEIAARVCKLLDYRLFDRTLMDRMAAEVGLSPSQIVDFSEADHQTRGFLERLFSRPTTVAQIRTWTEDTKGVRRPEVQELDQAQAIDLVRGTIQVAYKHGNVVIVGRGGQVVLHDKPGVFHVRIEAPLEHRIQSTQEEEGLYPAQAQVLVEDRDRAAEDYLRRFYGVDASDSRYYHLVINTGLLDVDTATHLIVTAIQRLEQHRSEQDSRLRPQAAVSA